MSRVTIQALARELGLSKSTVSRALNDYPDISPATKRRVSAVALHIGYHPSSQARGLRTGRTQAIGLVLDMDTGNTHRPFLSNFLDGISSQLSHTGWTLSVATASGMEGMVATHRKLLLDHKVDGFIVPRNHRDDGRIALLKANQTPYVVYGRGPANDTAPCFDVLSEDAMCQAVQRLFDFGHRHIAYVGGHVQANYERIRREGFLKGMSEKGLVADQSLCTHHATTEDEGRLAGERLLRTSKPPTAVVCAMDRAALGICQAIHNVGLKAGKDVSVTGYDGIPEGQYAQPRLTSFAVDNYFAGATLARLLVASIEKTSIAHLHELQAVRILTGESDGPVQMSSQELAAQVRQFNHTI